MLRKTLISLFLFVAASIQFSQSAAQPKLTMTSNVTTAKVGQPFTLRCKLENAIPETKDYNIEFWYSVNGQLAVFHFYNSASKNDTAFTFQGNFNDRNQQHIASLVPLPHKADSGVYELVVVAKTNFTTSFYCVKPIWAINYNSNHLILAVINSHIAEPTTTTKPPQKEVQVTISTNVTEHYRLKEAFNLRCSIAHFEAKGKRYSVQYYNSRDGRFASFDVDASGKSFLSIGEDFKKFNAHLGAKSEFPTFELVITENINATLNYWCQLQLVQGPTNEVFKSAVWKPSGLYLSFTSANTEPKTKSHIGRCTIHGFEKHTSVDYDVSFYTDLGDQSNRFLGSFAVRVNRTTEFLHELHLDHWTSIAANVAGQTSYPSFEIIVQTDVKVSARNTAWWCWLRIARPGQNEYRLLESNKQKMEE